MRNKKMRNKKTQKHKDHRTKITKHKTRNERGKRGQTEAVRDVVKGRDKQTSRQADRQTGGHQNHEDLEHSTESNIEQLLSTYWAYVPICTELPGTAVDIVFASEPLEASQEGQKAAARVSKPVQSGIKTPCACKSRSG